MPTSSQTSLLSPTYRSKDRLKPMLPLPKLKYLPGASQSSDDVSDVSELFKEAALSRESGTAMKAASTFKSREVGSFEPCGITSHFIHLGHLCGKRCHTREITPLVSLIPPPPPGSSYNLQARLHSQKFPHGHSLNAQFVDLYKLEDELGAGGYGFVMTARERLSRVEVAVKFITKEKIPDYAWMDDEILGRIPAEAAILQSIDHENIVKFLDLFEDDLYFYLILELHGTPWKKGTPKFYRVGSSMSTPSLSPSISERSLEPSEPTTPPSSVSSCLSMGSTIDGVPFSGVRPNLFVYSEPEIIRRSSYDLFECIEQSLDKRLSESQARYVFSQVVDAVLSLHSRGIAHRDIKDENLVIDQNLKVKLIDFGSACAVDPTQPRPYYNQFFGTAAYASSEILQKKRYQAAPAEVWTLGVLLSYLLTGTSAFTSVRATVEGRIKLVEPWGEKLSEESVDLMHKCLDVNPDTRITMQGVANHPWLASRSSSGP